MPLHEYECSKCHKRFERIQKFSDPPVELCPSCGGQVTRLLSSPAIHFKGGGWYVTDYARKSATSEKSSTEPSPDESSARLVDSKKSEKSEKKESPAAKKPSED